MPLIARPKRRRPGRFRRYIVRPAVWGTVLAISAVALALWLAYRGPVQEWATHRLVERVEAKLGRPVGVGSLRFSLLPLWVEARDVWVAGETPTDPPLAAARSVLVEADPWGLTRSILELSRVRVEGLRVRLERDEAGLHLPSWVREGNSQLEVRVGLVEAVDGRFDLDERTLPLSLTARAVHGQVQQTGGGELAGRIAAQEVDVSLPGRGRVSLSVAGKVRLGVRAVQLEAVRVNAPLIDVRVDGTVSFAPETVVDLAVAGAVDSELAVALGMIDGGVEGRLQLTGDFGWRARSWGFRSDVEAERLTVFGRHFEAVRGRAAGDRSSVHLDLARARYAGGSFAGRIHAIDEEGWRCEVDLVLDGLDLPTLMQEQGIPPPELAARVGGVFDYRFDLAAAQQGNGWAQLRVAGAAAEGRLALSGEVPLTIQGGVIGIAGAQLAGSGQRFRIDGRYDLASSSGRFSFGLESADVRPVFEAIPGIDTEQVWVPTSGQGTVEAVLEIDRGATAVDFEVDLTEVVSAGLRADRVSGAVRLGSAGVERLRLDLARPAAALLVQGRIPFSPQELSPLELSVDAAGWPIEEAQPWLPFELPLSGRFSGAVTLRQWPDGIDGVVKGAVEGAGVAGLELERLAADLAFDAETLTVHQLIASDAAGTIDVDGRYGIEGGELSLAFAGSDLDLAGEPLASLLGERLAGRASIRGRIAGTASDPTVEVEVIGRALAVGGRPLGKTGEARLTLLWDDGRVTGGGSLLGLAEVRGGGRLDSEACDLEFELQQVDLAVLAALVTDQPPAALAGRAAGRLTVAGGTGGTALRFAVRLDELGIDFAGQHLKALQPVELEMSDATLKIRSLYVGSAATDELFVVGSVGLEVPYPLDLRLQSSLGNHWLSELLPGFEIDGTTDLLATIGGTVERPRVNGQGEVRDSRVLIAGFPHAVEKLSAVLLFSPGEVVLDSASAELGGGSLQGEGRLRLPTPRQDTTFRLQLEGKQLSLRYPAGWLLRGDASLRLTRDLEGQRLSGVLELERAVYQRDLEIDAAKLLARFFRRQRLEAGESDQSLASTQLDLSIEVAPEGLRVRNDVADLEGRADLVLRGTLARPVVFGTVEAEPGGSLVYSGNRYEVERGLLTFASSQKIDPLVDLSASARVADYDLRLTLSGTLDRLNASFASDPPLPDLEVLSLLTGGEGLRSRVESGTAAPSQPLASAAEGLLFGQASSLISKRVSTLFGLDTFRVEPLTSGGESVSSARVRVGKRVSKRLHVGYSYDPTSIEEQRFEVEWLVAGGLTVLLTQNGNDTYSVDLRWEQRF